MLLEDKVTILDPTLAAPIFSDGGCRVVAQDMARVVATPFEVECNLFVVLPDESQTLDSEPTMSFSSFRSE